MGTLQVQNINLAFSDRDILSNVNFTLNEKSRCALTGGNGSGKSTLFKVINSDLHADSINISKTKGLRISYLPQSDIVFETDTLVEEVEKSYHRFYSILKNKKILEERLEKSSENENLEPLLFSLHEIQEQLLEGGYFDRKITIEKILLGLGFSTSDFERTCNEFSGGWQMRIALAKVLLEKPDIMLLDEPTNYLDIEARIWLKNYLRAYKGGLMLVSHDQGFLDETINEVYELFNAKITHYSGNYSSYLKQRDIEIAQKEKLLERQLAHIEKTEQFVERFRYKASKSKQVQSRIKQIEKIDLIEVPSHLEKLHFTFPKAPHSGNDVLKVKSLTKCYGDIEIFKDLNFLVSKNDRIAVTGRNGEGKSTLLRMLCNRDKEFSGEIVEGSNVEIGYFAQDTEKTLNANNSVFEELETVSNIDQLPLLRNYLGAFLFKGDDVFKSIGVLSGGERSRLALLKILMHPVNLLILDEPTNHLDINAKEMLIKALNHYNGTMIFVSHDTYFIEHLATRILYLSEEKPTFFEGDYNYFKYKLEEKEKYQDEQEIENDDKIESKGSLNYKAQRERTNKINKLNKDNQKILEKNEKITQSIKKLEDQMSKIEIYSNAEKINKVIEGKSIYQNKLDKNEELWLQNEEELLELSDN
jgi:ATP-binding cassette subfamily F protein 3